jgi:hypothetical protein
MGTNLNMQQLENILFLGDIEFGFSSDNILVQLFIFTVKPYYL